VKHLYAILIFLGTGLGALAAEVIPPAPTQYFNDYAHVVSAGVASQLNQTLETFERDTSEQILVAIFPKMQSDSSIEDYTVRVARAWRVGKQASNNGAVLFVFIQDHQMFLQVGYGLEGALPDAICKRIVDDEISPRFKAGDFNGGLTAGVQAIMAATKGEYHGNGKTAADSHRKDSSGLAWGGIEFFVILFFVVLSLARARRRGLLYTGSGFGGGWGGGWGGGGGGGGGFSGGGGGFSGGGGSFGGGGAGGSW
jgi:uncharacterized protein